MLEEVDLAVLSNRIAELTLQVEALSQRFPVQLVTVAEAAKVLDVAEVTVRRQIKEGKLPHVKIGRSVRVDLSRVASVKGRN